MYEAQRALVNAQAHGFVVPSSHCLQCGAALSIKAKHIIQYQTVFGKITIDSPQLRGCKCSQNMSNKSFRLLAAALPGRLSPELEYLQVKWAAHLSYAVATALLKKTLPVDQSISISGLRKCVWKGAAKNWTTPPKVPFAVNAPIRQQTASPRLSPWRWVPHGYATARLARNKTKPNLLSVSPRSGFCPLGDT